MELKLAKFAKNQGEVPLGFGCGGSPDAIQFEKREGIF
jgi:hypothetical protein